MADDPNDGAIREGEPPYASNVSRRDDAPPNEISESSSRDWIGGGSLVCGCIAGLGTCLILSADMGHVPREIKLGGISHLVTLTCWLMAFFGGVLSAVAYRSKAGCLALFLGVLIPLAVMSLVCLIGSGWQD